MTIETEQSTLDRRCRWLAEKIENAGAMDFATASGLLSDAALLLREAENRIYVQDLALRSVRAALAGGQDEQLT